MSRARRTSHRHLARLVADDRIRAEGQAAARRGGGAIEIAAVRTRSQALVPAADLDAVVAMAVNELHRLHEGNIARFGLRLSDYRQWKK